MLRASKQQEETVVVKRSWNLLMFSIGGERLAVRTDDVGGIAPWQDPIPVPSRTPFVQAMLRREHDVMPVYDLAGRLNRSLIGEPLLCLVAKHTDGPMAICIDGEMPSLHTIDIGMVQPMTDQDVETLGRFLDHGGYIPIVALQTLGGSHARNTAGASVA